MNRDPNLHQILGRLQAEVKNLNGSMDSVSTKVDGIATEQIQIKTELTKYKGFMGGVAFVFGAAGTAIGFVITYVKTGGW